MGSGHAAIVAVMSMGRDRKIVTSSAVIAAVAVATFLAWSPTRNDGESFSDVPVTLDTRAPAVTVPASDDTAPGGVVTGSPSSANP